MATKKYFILLAFFIFISFYAQAQTQAPQPQGAVAAAVDSVTEYNSQALQFINTAHYDESMDVLQQALRGNKTNYITYYLLCRVYNAEYNWDEGIKAGEKSLQLDTAFKNTYLELFKAYYQSGKWQDALRVSGEALKLDRDGVIPFEIKAIDAAMTSESFSTPLIMLFLLILAGVLFIPIYKASKNNTNYFSSGREFRFSDVLLMGASISCMIWLLFFAMANWVWSLHPHINAYDIAVYVRIFIFERDGMESVVLYMLMIVNVLATLVAMPLLLKTKSNKGLYLTVYVTMFLVTAYYFLKLGFAPPIADIDTKNFLIPVVVTLGALGIYMIYQKYSLLAKLCVLALTAFVGLISLGPPSLTDLSYILDPALRYMHGFKVSEIYFQYDIFLSFLAWVWMKLNLELITFAYLGQISFFLFFIGSFFFTDRYFKSKGLSVLFIIALMLARFYTIWGDHPTIFQVTPIRLDLWLILVFVAWKKGVNHWLVGMCLGLLVLFHRNLGLIYLGSYVELVLMMFLLDIIPLFEEKNLNIKSLSALFMRHLRMNLVNIIIVISSIALCFILFKEMFSASALIYRKLGVGMLPISRVSFYWYISVLYSCLIALLVYYRNKLGIRYVSIGMFILFLAIGNSMYFFGRSHENNILNVSGIFVFVLFIIFDILISTASTEPMVAEPKKVESPAKTNPQNTKKNTPQPVIKKKEVKGSFLTLRNICIAIPVLFILLTSFYYSDRIQEKVGIQYDSLQQSQFAYTTPYMPADTAAISAITRHSDKVYFQDFSIDFYYYYYGHYAPLGYFSPCASWVYKKDVLDFLQGLLNKHYYIVADSFNFNQGSEYFPALDYNRSVRMRNMIAISKEETTLLLPQTPGTDFHLGLVDSMSGQAIERAGVKIKDEFTLEIVLKPMGPQPLKCVVINNLVNYGGLKGFTLQMNNPAANQFVFGFGTGQQTLPNTTFVLEDYKWNYVTVVVSKQFLKIYDNGKLLSAIASGISPFINSESPIVIGNSSARDSHFKGYIKEVKISDGNMNETDIISTGQKLDVQLNGQVIAK